MSRTASRHLPALLSLLLGAALFAPNSASAAEPAARHPFSTEDLLAMQRLSEPAPSPNGSLIAFVVRRTDLEANRGISDLWLVKRDGTGLRQLTSTAAAEWQPRWSPDGRTLFFLSTRSGSAQLFMLPLDGGEAIQVTALEEDVATYKLSPDGTMLLLSAETFPECDDLACSKERLAANAAKKTTGRIYKEALFRHWDTWADGRRSHLFAMPVAGGKAIDLMKGMAADSPSKPWGGAEEYAFSPDGKSALFTARDEGRSEAWSTNHDLFQVPLDGSAKPVRLTSDNKAWDTAPVFSPDGSKLVYKAMSKPGYEADRFRVMLRDWPGDAKSKAREVAPRWDRSPHELVWSPDGATLYATADNLGHVSIFAIEVATGTVRTIAKEGSWSNLSLAGGLLFATRDDIATPAELFSLDPNTGRSEALTQLNAPLLSTVKMGAAEQFSFKGAKGRTVYGWVVKPAEFAEGKRYPVAFLVHGGPQGSFGNHFHYRWNPQSYAGRGYAAVMIDFTGSTGYGQAFTDAIQGDWGGAPLEDLQKGLAAARAKYSFIDRERGCALGASYGAYMMNWIAGAWSDGFQCLVAHNGNLDEQMAYYATEELWFPEREHGGTPWENPRGYDKHNPINLVKNWKTPVMVVHGAKDFRVVETQGMATFTAAQRKGIPSQFLYFPDENHWVLKPQNSLLWHNTVLDWLDQWTKPAAKATAEK